MAYSLVQTAKNNTGGASASSLTITSSATGSGNLLVASVYVHGTALTITPPTGWTQIGTTQGVVSGTGSFAMFYFQNSTSGVTSHAFTFSVAGNAAAALEEWSGVATTSALDQFVVQQNAKATADPTGTTAALAGTGELAIWANGVGASGILTYGTITNSYVEDASSNSVSTQATRAQTTMFNNTSVGSAATSSGSTMSGTGAAGNTTILAVFKPAGGVTPVLGTSPTTLSFSATTGGASPATQNDTLSETAGAATAWTSAISYGSGSGWLGISPTSGSLGASGTQTVVFTCTTGALSPGTYTATVTYTATTGGSTATVGVTFVVNAITPVLSTSPTTLSFSATAGGGSPATQNDTLSETAGAATAWTSGIAYGSGSGWLAISPTSGSLLASGNATIVYTCTTGVLAAGTYTATVTYTATTGGATATVVVTFTVLTPASASTSPGTMAFSGIVGGSNPATQNDTLTNTGGTSSGWTSATTYGSGSGWLGVSSASGTLGGGANATITYTCTIAGLTPGTYTATVTYTMAATTATVVVTLTITSPTSGLYTIPLNTKTTTVQAADVNQAVHVLQQPGGGQEIGHYFLQQPIYVAGGTASWYITHLSRTSVPVSVSLDSSDQGQVGFTTTVPNTGTLKPAGFQIFAFAVTGPQPNARVGGLYTTQF